ncbi:adenylate/guanylate cyclase domain-containing protein, partial [candidate division CSSED10-310 bacterium]
MALCTNCGAELLEDITVCKTCGHVFTSRLSVTSPPEESPFSPEVRAASSREMTTVTVLIAHAVGFSAMSEIREPEEVRLIRQQVLSIAKKCITDHGGFFETHREYDVSALFGVARPLDDNAYPALRAAIQFQEELKSFNEKQQKRGFPLLQLRIGINTGRALAAAVEGRDWHQSPVLAATIEVGALLEQACPPGGIRMAHETYRHVR